VVARLICSCRKRPRLASRTWGTPIPAMLAEQTASSYRDMQRMPKKVTHDIHIMLIVKSL